MGDLFEKYGWIAVGVLIITVFIAFTTPVGDIVKENVMKFIENITTAAGI